MGVLHMPTAAGHHPLKSCPRHEATPQIILKSVTFTMTTDSPSRAPPLESLRCRASARVDEVLYAAAHSVPKVLLCLHYPPLPHTVLAPLTLINPFPTRPHYSGAGSGMPPASAPEAPGYRS